MIGTISSFLLLWLSFPCVDWWMLAWISFIPFFFVLEGQKKRTAFLWGYGLGLLFFGANFYWLIHVTLPGMLLVVFYLALYFGFFALGYRFFSAGSFSEKLIFIPSLWVTLEFIRGHLLSGLGWASLGHSQSKNLMMIQIADTTGVAGVSFMVMMVNVAIKEWLSAIALKQGFKKLFIPTLIVAVLLTAMGGYGFYRLNQRAALPEAKIAVVQANIPLMDRWTQFLWPEIIEKHLKETKEVLVTKPELVIWSETAFPGLLSESPELFENLKEFAAAHKTPLLVGAVTQEKDQYYNSALMISAGGDIIGQYNKLHLVPFGEYIPFRSLLPFLSNIVPIDDFTSGGDFTVLAITPDSSKGPRLGVLICFEDTIGELSRGFVKRGANILVNITNDAWFQETAAPFLHLQAAVFRTIENRRSLIRSANTGVSCFIDPQGRVIQYLENSEGKKTYVSGNTTASVPISYESTLYTKLGDIFTYFCFGCILFSYAKARERAFASEQ